MVTASDIIDALGGTSATAELIHAPVSTVHSWRRIGINQSRLAHLQLAANAAGKDAPWPADMQGVPGTESSHPTNREKAA